MVWERRRYSEYPTLRHVMLQSRWRQNSNIYKLTKQLNFQYISRAKLFGAEKFPAELRLLVSLSWEMSLPKSVINKRMARQLSSIESPTEFPVRR